MRVILTGATGAAGLGILRTLLADDTIAHVTVLSRRPLPAWVELPGGNSPSTPDGSPTHPKLDTTVLSSFHTYPTSLFSDHDACIWALGKSQRGMSEKDYTEMTVGFVDSFLDAAKATTVGSVEKPFRFVYISGEGVDPSEKSHFLFSRIKGRAETHLTQFADNSGGTFKATHLRLGYFFPSLNYPKDALNTRSISERVLDSVLGGLTRATVGITVEDIGAFATESVKGTWDEKGPVIRNSEMKKLLKELRAQ